MDRHSLNDAYNRASKPETRLAIAERMLRHQDEEPWKRTLDKQLLRIGQADSAEAELTRLTIAQLQWEWKHPVLARMRRVYRRLFSH